MSGLKVTPAQLSELGAATARVAGEVRSEHHRLRGQLTPLFGSEWSGAAATQFTTLYEQSSVDHMLSRCRSHDNVAA